MTETKDSASNEDAAGRGSPELWVQSGHFYSPIPDLDEVRERERELFDTPRFELPGIDLNEGEQLELLEVFREFYGEEPFAEGPRPELRYHADNPYFGYGDGS